MNQPATRQCEYFPTAVLAVSSEFHCADPCFYFALLSVKPMVKSFERRAEAVPSQGETGWGLILTWPMQQGLYVMGTQSRVDASTWTGSGMRAGDEEMNKSRRYERPHGSQLTWPT